MVRLSNLLDNGEAEAETFAIYLCCALKFAEAREDLADIFTFDAVSSVLNANAEILLILSVEHADQDKSALRKLNRVSHEIHQDLLDSTGVAQQFWKGRYIHIWNIITLYLCSYLDAFVTSHWSENANYLLQSLCHIERRAFQCELTTSYLAKIEQIIYEALQEFQLAHHYGAVLDRERQLLTLKLWLAQYLQH